MDLKTIGNAVLSWCLWANNRRADYLGLVGEAGYCWVFYDPERTSGCLWWSPGKPLRGPMRGDILAFM